MKKYYYLFSFLSVFLFFPVSLFAKTVQQREMKNVRDSLLLRLENEKDCDERLSLLLNIGDIDLTLSNDYTYVEQLWKEAIKCQNEDMTIASGKSLFLRWNSKGTLDSADVWLDRCRRNFFGESAEGNLAYLSMMREIRDFDELEQLSARLVSEKVKIKDSDSPYKKMRLLFLMGVLAANESTNNKSLKSKSSAEYHLDGLKIARTLPLKEGFSFYMQFLIAVANDSPLYIDEMIKLRARYKDSISPDYRPYASCRGDIIAYARLMKQGECIGEQKMDEYFIRFNELTSKFPFECPTPYDYYYYNSALSYYKYKKDWKNALMCCDSAILNAPKYKQGFWQFLDERGECLAHLNDFEGAYNNSLWHMKVKDSLASASVADKLMELQTQYDVDILESENKTINQFLFFITLFFIILVVVLLLMVYWYKLLRNKNKNLIKQIREKENIERKIVKVVRSLSKDSLSHDEQLFLRIEELLDDKRILTVQKLGRDQLAEFLSTNRTYVANAISKCADGMNVSEYINTRRVKLARMMLEQNPEYTIDEIADLSGFSSRSRFHSTFRDFYKMTPGEFRRLIRKAA